jgi:acyl carrier protein
VRSAGSALELPGSAGASPERDRDADGWLGTRDLVRADGDGYLRVVGRRSTFVNVNGAKADPREIEGVIEELPWVAECAVVGAKGPGGGERIVAYVAPRPGRDVPYPEEAVQQRVAESLSVFKVPSRVVLLDALPRTTLGKLAYARLPDLETAAPARAAGGEPPRDETERQVAALWCEVLGLGGVGVKDGFGRLGGTSVQLAELVARLEQRFGRSLTIVDLFRYPTVEAQARALSGQSPHGSASGVEERARRQLEAFRASAGRAGTARGATAHPAPERERAP